jgi:hypothetical protein
MNKTFLDLNGEITPLTLEEEGQLKGGFGTLGITLKAELNWGSNNGNCTNSSLSNNDNCKCSACDKTAEELENDIQP